MKNPKLVFAIVLGVVFCFAGYNLWSYFKEQQAIQAEEDRLAEERRIQVEQEKQARLAAEAEEQRRRDAEAETRRLEVEAKKLEEERLAAEARAARDAEREAARLEAERRKAEKAAAQLARRIKEARTPPYVEEVPEEFVQKLSGLSHRYILDNPKEFLEAQFNPDTFSRMRGSERLIQEKTDALMLFSALTKDTQILQALLDIGMDINAQNQLGYTPLMFAAAYGKPEIVQFLIAHGADLTAQAYYEDLTPLHIAAALNPHPDVVETLVKAGADIEATTKNPMTPLLLACSDNRNIEVSGRLAELGANTEVFSADGLAPKGICEQRVNGIGSFFVQISDELNEQVLSQLTP